MASLLKRNLVFCTGTKGMMYLLCHKSSTLHTLQAEGYKIINLLLQKKFTGTCAQEVPLGIDSLEFFLLFSPIQALRNHCSHRARGPGRCSTWSRLWYCPYNADVMHHAACMNHGVTEASSHISREGLGRLIRSLWKGNLWSQRCIGDPRKAGMPGMWNICQKSCRH